MRLALVDIAMAPPELPAMLLARIAFFTVSDAPLAVIAMAPPAPAANRPPVSVTPLTVKLFAASVNDRGRRDWR